jgi:hypothetical protein
VKTNKSMTKCPGKIGHLCIRFGHFRLTDTNFAEIRGEFTVKRQQYRVCGRRSRLGRSERENPVRNEETPGSTPSGSTEHRSRLYKLANSTLTRAVRIFGVRELGPAFSTADSSAVWETPRRFAARESGDKSPHSETEFFPRLALPNLGAGLPLGDSRFLQEKNRGPQRRGSD